MSGKDRERAEVYNFKNQWVFSESTTATEEWNDENKDTKSNQTTSKSDRGETSNFFVQSNRPKNNQKKAG